MSSVVVVGAGIVGASVAYHCARLGLQVTLIDRGSAPAAGVTGESFAWVGDAGTDWPGGAEDLRGCILADYRRLEAELPAVSVRWTGSLAWPESSVPLATAALPGRGQRWVDRDEIRQLEPKLLSPPDRAVFTPADGGVDPVRMTQELVDGARSLGARIVLDCAVEPVLATGGRVQGVRSSKGFHPAPTVVLAAGTESAGLCEPLGVALPVVPSPAVLMRASAPPGLIRTVVASPAYEARELRDGQLLMTAPYDEQLSRPVLARLAEQTVQQLRADFLDAASVRLTAVNVGYRPMPADGPLIGYVTPDRSVYVAVMHSAVCLAPTVGRLVAQELATGKPVGELRRSTPASRISPPCG